MRLIAWYYPTQHRDTSPLCFNSQSVYVKNDFVSHSLQPSSSATQFRLKISLPTNLTYLSKQSPTGSTKAGRSQPRASRHTTETLARLIHKFSNSESPVDCVVYDSHLPWALDVAKGLGLRGASYFTQPCAVCSINFHGQQKLLKLPVLEDGSVISLPGLPPLEPADLPAFLYRYGLYPLFMDMALGQFSNIHKADWVLANTFFELEQEVIIFYFSN